MNQILPQFQKFMADRMLVAENQIPFYAGWASKFIRFSNERQFTPIDLKIQLFLDDLKKNPEIQDWQAAKGWMKNTLHFTSLLIFSNRTYIDGKK